MANGFVRWLVKLLRWLLVGLGFLCKVVLAAWAALAIYYSNLPRLCLSPLCFYACSHGGFPSARRMIALGGLRWR